MLRANIIIISKMYNKLDPSMLIQYADITMINGINILKRVFNKLLRTSMLSNPLTAVLKSVGKTAMSNIVTKNACNTPNLKKIPTSLGETNLAIT